MGEIADEQNEANAKRMQQPDQAHALAGRVVKHPGDANKGKDCLSHQIPEKD